MTWLDIFDHHVEAKGPAVVARELGISPTTVSLVKNGKYGASTDNIERKVLTIYGAADGLVACPVIGPITPDQCATNHYRAKKIGMASRNPQTLRLFKACLKCNLRNG